MTNALDLIDRHPCYLQTKPIHPDDNRIDICNFETNNNSHYIYFHNFKLYFTYIEKRRYADNLVFDKELNEEFIMYLSAMDLTFFFNSVKRIFSEKAQIELINYINIFIYPRQIKFNDNDYIQYYYVD